MTPLIKERARARKMIQRALGVTPGHPFKHLSAEFLESQVPRWAKVHAMAVERKDNDMVAASLIILEGIQAELKSRNP